MPDLVKVPLSLCTPLHNDIFGGLKGGRGGGAKNTLYAPAFPVGPVPDWDARIRGAIAGKDDYYTNTRE